MNVIIEEEEKGGWEEDGRQGKAGAIIRAELSTIEEMRFTRH